MSDDFDTQAIKDRLHQSLKDASISLRAASINAGVGTGYVQHLVTSDVEPSISKLATICEKNGISLAFVLLGLDLSPQKQRLLDLIEKDPSKLESLLVLLEK